MNHAESILKRITKGNIRKDDSLFGLLSLYKSYNSYFRVLENDVTDEVMVIVVSNPGNWGNISETDIENFTDIRRIKLGVNKMSLKYLLPEHLISVLGPFIGIKIPVSKMDIINSMENRGYYIVRTSRRYMPRIISGLKKIINLTPQKKYEILEKSFVKEQD